MQHNNALILDNLFHAKQPLFILSSQRIKHEFYLRFAQKDTLDFNLNTHAQDTKEFDTCLQNCFDLFDFKTYTKTQQTQTFLPSALTIAEFFQKITYTNLAKVPKNIRDCFMFQALQNRKDSQNNKTKTNFLHFEQSFVLFLQTSSVLLDFYDELREHKIPITTKDLLLFDQIDSYGEYSEQLTLLATIYEQYTHLLQLNNLTDSLYSNDIKQNYLLFTEYIASFSSIHIELEGFISPLQFEILESAAKITPIFLHFKTDQYNIAHFKILNKDLVAHKRYIYAIAEKNIFAKDIKKLNNQNLKLYKGTHSLHQANLALYLAHKWQQEILENKASENDFAIILPNESFCNHLNTLDSLHLLNFAMGISIQSSQEFRILQAIYDNFLITKTLALQDLFEFLHSHTQEHIQKPLQKLQEKTQDASIKTPTLSDIEDIIKLLFAHEESLLTQAILILSELSILDNQPSLQLKNLTFEQLFTLFMRNFSATRINDVGGGKIRVMGALEARSLVFKEVLILDFTDDYVPNVTHDDVFLNSKIRSHYNMPTRLDKENLYKHHYYSIMQNAQTTHICYLLNEEKIASNMLFELECNLELAQSIDECYSYYDINKQNDQIFYDEEYPSFNLTDYSLLSASSLNIYKDCVRKFYFRYIEKLKEEEKTQQQTRGILLHQWLFETYSEHKNKVLNTSDIKLIEERFFAKFYSLSNAMLENNTQEIDVATFIAIENFMPKMRTFFQNETLRVQQHKIEILELEYKFNIQHQDYTFTGYIDRIDRVDNSIVIYDYKNGAKKPHKDDLQMSFYALCVSNFESLQKYKDLEYEFMYYLLGAEQSKMLVKKQESELIAGEQTITELLQNFGNENKMTDERKICKNCPYTILCNRD